MRLIAITGGIGSGKSVVSAIVSALGYPVYDCDRRAKALIDNTPTIIAEIGEKISPRVVGDDGRLLRAELAAIVFSDSSQLSLLNAITHRHVIDDVRRWTDANDDREALFVETAILYESGLDRMVDEVWEVTAPVTLRIARVMKRNACDAEQVKARIKAQRRDDTAPRHPSTHVIINDDITPMLPQIEHLLNLIG